MHGPKHLTDEEVLGQAIAREDELRGPCGSWSGRRPSRNMRASERERERDEARESASAIGERYEKLQQTYRKEREAHGSTKSWVFVTGLVAVALLVINLCACVATADVGVGQ